MARLNSENYGRKALRNTALVLLATRVLPASPKFGQAKYSQKGPTDTFAPKGFVPLCKTAFSPFMADLPS